MPLEASVRQDRAPLLHAEASLQEGVHGGVDELEQSLREGSTTALRRMLREQVTAWTACLKTRVYMMSHACMDVVPENKGIHDVSRLHGCRA